MNILDIIDKKQNNKKLSKAEIEYFVKEYTAGNIPDYQAAALVMAIYINGMDEEEITYYALEPRTRVATVKTKRQPAQDYNLEKEQQRLEILEHKQAQNEKLKSYIQDGVVDFEKIDTLDGESRKILLSWLSKGLNDISKTAKTDDGRDFYIDDSNLKTIEVKCEDGIFVMPSYRICFKR